MEYRPVGFERKYFKMRFEWTRTISLNVDFPVNMMKNDQIFAQEYIFCAHASYAPMDNVQKL